MNSEHLILYLSVLAAFCYRSSDCLNQCTRGAGTNGNSDQRYKSNMANSFLTSSELEKVKTQLQTDEGYKTEIYLDSEGLPTFGIGHLIVPSDKEYGKPVGTKVSEQRVTEAFNADVAIASTDVYKVFPNADSFPSEVKQIVVNMVFNLGISRLGNFKKFIAAVNRNDWKTAAGEMMDSKWYRQVGKRADRLVNRMRNVAGN